MKTLKTLTPYNKPAHNRLKMFPYSYNKTLHLNMITVSGRLPFTIVQHSVCIFKFTFIFILFIFILLYFLYSMKKYLLCNAHRSSFSNDFKNIFVCALHILEVDDANDGSKTGCKLNSWDATFFNKTENKRRRKIIKTNRFMVNKNKYTFVLSKEKNYAIIKVTKSDRFA